MAHPFQEHKAYKVSRSRVMDIAGKHESPKHYAAGGGVSAPSSVKRSVTKALTESVLRADGGAVQPRADRAPRRARGGKVKGKGHGKTQVNVIVAPGGGGMKPPAPPMPPPGPPPVSAAPPMPPRPPMPPPSPAGMAGPGGPGGMPPPPMRAAGGAVEGKKSLAAVKGATGIGDRTPISHSGNKNDTQNIGRKAVITRATGGKLEAYGAKMSPTFPHKAGAGSGIARKAKAHMKHGDMRP